MEQQLISPDVGSRLLFENEQVRVWDLRLEPGESTGLHRHTTDFFYVVIGDGALQRLAADGSSQPPRQMADGEVHFRQVSGEDVHEALNVGSGRWRNIVVELLKPKK
jgi:predicted metal-dependent enzyme (double-stranded beta helix superfamily)